MGTLPTTQGDSIYANSEGVQVFTKPDISANRERNGKNGDVVSFEKGTFIGKYTGIQIGNFYEVDYIIDYRFGLFKFGSKDRLFTGYLLDKDITTISAQEIKDEKKEAANKEFEKQLKEALDGGKTQTGVTGSSGEEKTTDSTTILVISGLALLLLGGLYVYTNREKETKEPAVSKLNKP